MRHDVVELKSALARDPLFAGGKGSGLARLLRFGFDVPDGFVIGTPVFHDMTRALGIVDRLAPPPTGTGSPPNPEALDALGRTIVKGTLPDAARRRITSAYRRLGGPVAVRSSMVGEDHESASLAGQLDTVLDVESEDELLAALNRCYASVCGARLRHYLAAIDRKRSRSVNRTISLALIVQRMVHGAFSGVAFSADPQTGRRCVIIEAAAGPDNTVADGTAEPMRWVVNARGVLVERCGASGSGVELPDEEILRLAGMVRKVAACFGCPQDIEWIWDGGRFCFLQSRPITTLSGREIYSNALVSDMSPGLIKPLLWSTNTLSMATNVFGRLFTELVGPNDIDFKRLSRRIHSRVYTNVTLLGEVFLKIGLPANFFEMLARDETGERPPVRPSVVRLILHHRVLRFAARYLRARRMLSAFISAQDAVLQGARTADLGTSSPRDLMRRAEECMVIHGDSQWHVFLAAVNMMLRKRLLDRFLNKHAGGTGTADVLRGLTRLKSLEPNRRFEEMAAIARRLDDASLRELAGGPDGSIRGALAASSTGSELIAKVDAFVDEYGFLSASGTDFSTESWAERPELVWQTIARLSAHAAEPPARSPDGDGATFARRVGRSLGPLHRWWFRRLRESTIAYMDLRERASLLLSEDAYQMRRVFLELGRRLAEENVLEAADDVFYLYIEELRELVAGTRDPRDVVSRVRQRRAEMDADALVEPLDTICGDAIPPREALYEHIDGWCHGIGGSPGAVEGRAVVLHDPAEAPPDLTRGDILVVPFTDIGWTPLFVGIGGVVAETGGQLSHTCIVAREYGLPAVVSVRGATRLFKTGDPITVDGHRGRVHAGHILTRARSAT